MGDTTINMRTDAVRKQRLQVAAEISGRTLSGFILDAAYERADEVIEAERTTRLPADFFDEFFDGLGPEPTAVMRESIARLDDVVVQGD